jgi:non-homologous end joining protein Ku
MAEPSTSLHIWKGSIVLSFILVNIRVRLYAATVLFSFKDHRTKYKAEKSIDASTGDIMLVEVVRNK